MVTYYFLATILFVLGLVGVLIKKNIISMLLCIELMLNSVNLFFMLFSKTIGNLESQMMVLFVFIIAAAEAAIGLSIVILLFKKINSSFTNDIRVVSN